MKAKLNQKVVQQIAKEMKRNPVWALLRAREYFDSDSALYTAFKARATKEVEMVNYPVHEKQRLLKIIRDDQQPDNLKAIRPERLGSLSREKFRFNPERRLSRQSPVKRYAYSAG